MQSLVTAYAASSLETIEFGKAKQAREGNDDAEQHDELCDKEEARLALLPLRSLSCRLVQARRVLDPSCWATVRRSPGQRLPRPRPPPEPPTDSSKGCRPW